MIPHNRTTTPAKVSLTGTARGSWRGLTINGMGGTTGVSITNAASVSIENCVIANFSASGGAGILVNGAVPVRIVDTVLRNNFDGLLVKAGASADVNRVRALGNSDVGLYALGNTAGTTTSLVVGDSLVAGSGAALRAEANQATAVVRAEVIESTLVSGGYGAAAISSAGDVLMTVSDTLVTGNGTGLVQAGADAVLNTLGNNTVTGNTQDTSGTITPFSPVPHNAPSVTLTSPTSGQSFTGPANITLNATTNDPNGNIARVDFYQGNTKLGSATNPPYTYSLSNVPPGNYVFSARAVDSVSAQFVSAPVPVAVTNAVFYVFADHLNTPRAVTDSQQNVVWTNTPLAEPFGNSAPNEKPGGPNTNAFTFNLRLPGQYYDKETGLSYNYYRDYDPATGRYVQSDPIGLKGGINTFAYVDGSPVSYSDPKGQNPVVAGIAIAVIGGGVVAAVTPGSATDRAAAAFDFEIGLGVAVLTALAAPETILGGLAAVIFGTATDAALYSKNVAGVVTSNTSPAQCKQ